MHNYYYNSGVGGGGIQTLILQYKERKGEGCIFKVNLYQTVMPYVFTVGVNQQYLVCYVAVSLVKKHFSVQYVEYT
jgi:hypothetical protein